MPSPMFGVMMGCDAMTGLDFDRIGLFRCSLVPLRGAHWSHRHSETIVRREVGCCGECLNDEGEGASHGQARSGSKQHVHEENPARKDDVGAF
jgi:hypothetical protein